LAARMRTRPGAAVGAAPVRSRHRRTRQFQYRTRFQYRTLNHSASRAAPSSGSDSREPREKAGGETSGKGEEGESSFYVRGGQPPALYQIADRASIPKRDRRLLTVCGATCYRFRTRGIPESATSPTN